MDTEAEHGVGDDDGFTGRFEDEHLAEALRNLVVHLKKNTDRNQIQSASVLLAAHKPTCVFGSVESAILFRYHVRKNDADRLFYFRRVHSLCVCVCVCFFFLLKFLFLKVEIPAQVTWIRCIPFTAQHQPHQGQ